MHDLPELDGAKVIQWAWSGDQPFGFVPIHESEDKISIHGLAICAYVNSSGFYRFSCDENWEVIQDSHHETIEQAIEELPDQYKMVVAVWEQATP